MFIKDYPETLDGALLVGADIPESQATLSRLLGKDGISLSAAALTVDKFRMKQVLREAGVVVPDHFLIESADQLREIVQHSQTKMVLKPNDNCGSRGVQQVTIETDFESAFQYSKSHIKRSGVILESYVEGLQISIEGIVVNNQLHVTGFADRNYNMLEQLSPYVIENGATMPTILPEYDRKIVIDAFGKGVSVLGIHTGVVKGDMVFDGERAVIIEIAGRISGGKFASKLVPYSAGTNLLLAAIQQSLGEPVDLELLKEVKREGVAVRYFFPQHGILQRIEGLEVATSNSCCLEIVTAYQPGDLIPVITSHADRGGWVVCHAQERVTAVEQAEKIANNVKFIVN